MTSDVWVITSPGERDAFEFSAGATGVDAANDFIDDTDLSTQIVLIHQATIENCQARQLEQLKWEKSKNLPEGVFDLALKYTSVERDVNCEQDAPKDTEAIVMRIPAKVAEINSFAWGTASLGQSDC